MSTLETPAPEMEPALQERPAAHEEERSLAETYEAYAAQLRRIASRHGEPLRSIGLTACRTGEGVSTVAANLAVAAARSGDGVVTLVDANHVRPSLGPWFGLEGATGLSDVLAGHVSPRLALHSTSTERLMVMPAGIEPDTTGNHACDVAELLAKVAKAGDLAIVDLPAIDQSEAAITLAGELDGLLLVVEAEATSRFVIRRAAEQLQRAGGNLLGVVFNKRRQHIPDWLYRKL